MGSSSSPALPPIGAEGVAQESGAGAGVAGAAPLRVFLVEDSPSVRDRLNDFLAEPGVVEMIGFAETEADAVRALNAPHIDVAIVDLHLRQGSGIGVIESVRRMHPSPPPTIVVLTNYAFPEFEAACRERGADFFFDKVTQFGAVKQLLQSMRREGG